MNVDLESVTLTSQKHFCIRHLDDSVLELKLINPHNEGLGAIEVRVADHGTILNDFAKRTIWDEASESYPAEFSHIVIAARKAIVILGLKRAYVVQANGDSCPLLELYRSDDDRGFYREFKLIMMNLTGKISEKCDPGFRKLVTLEFYDGHESGVAFDDFGGGHGSKRLVILVADYIELLFSQPSNLR